MANDASSGSRNRAVKSRTQVRNPNTGDYAKRNETPGSLRKGEFMENQKRRQTPQRRPHGAG
jgi:hypothetical protein